MAYSLKVSSNGQVSIPAEVRRRWKAQRVLVIDRGDQVIVRPIPDDPIGSVIGKYAHRLPPAEQVRRAAREEETLAEDRLQ